MSINNLEKEIDQAFTDFQDKLDQSNFSLWIDPEPLKVWDKVEEEDVIVDEQEEEYKELDFSYWLCYNLIIYIIYKEVKRIMNNNVINFKEFKDSIKNEKKTYFVDFIDWKNYTILVEAESEQEAEEVVAYKVQYNDLNDVSPTKHLFEILKVQSE